MKEKCRFCGYESVRMLFSPTKGGKKEAAEFSCTNCGFGKHGVIVRCGNCRMVYVGEKISQKRISTYYEVADDPLYFAQQPARRKTFQRYLRRLEEIYPEKGKLLDVGTNTGLFVRLAIDAGWEAVGLEPNRWAAEYAKKNYDITLVNKPFDRKAFPKESFDVVTMWDVIEHFNDPVDQMANVFWYLRPGGVYAFSTVDPESLLAKFSGTHWPWYMEMHRAFLTPKTAEVYLKKAGFRKVVFRAHFRNLSLGYLATRLVAINRTLSEFMGKLFKVLHVDKVIIPYYANDVYDCYAFKQD